MNQNDINLVGDYSNFMESYVDSDLEHYRTGGEKKGVRRFQYPDGSLTPLGRIHYGVGPPRGEGKAESPDDPESPRMKKLASAFNERRAAAKAGIQKFASDYKERRAKAKAAEEAKKAEAAKAKRAKEVKEMTRTPDDLIKNRDKLTEEEFNAAVDKFEQLKKREAENQALLKKYNGLKDESPKELDDDEKENENPDGSLTEEGKAKLASEREQQVVKWTRTAEELVKNRGKLTDEEFSAAKARLVEEKRKRDEDEEILRTLSVPYSELPSPLRKAETSMRQEELRRYASSWDGKKLLANKGHFSKPEFDQLKMMIASKSLKNIEQLDSVLSNDEYQTAYDNYTNRTGKVNRQKQAEFINGANTFKTALGTAYDTIDVTSKLATGRSVQDLAKATIGKGIMGAMESVQYDTAVNQQKMAQNVEKVSAAMVKEMDQLLKRAGKLDDETYVNTLYQYYDALYKYINNGNKPGGNKPGGNKPGGKP